MYTALLIHPAAIDLLHVYVRPKGVRLVHQPPHFVLKVPSQIASKLVLIAAVVIVFGSAVYIKIIWIIAWLSLLSRLSAQASGALVSHGLQATSCGLSSLIDS